MGLAASGISGLIFQKASAAGRPELEMEMKTERERELEVEVVKKGELG